MTLTPHKNSALLARSLPVIYPNLFLEIARERGVASAAILGRAGLESGLLADPAGRVSSQEFMRLVEATVALAGDDGIAFEVGLRQPLTAHGSVGLAMMCCPTVGEAAQLLQRFWHLRGRGVDLEFQTQGEQAMFTFVPVIPIPDTARRMLMSSMLASFHRGLEFALGGSDPGLEICFEYARPDYAERFAGRLPSLHFNRPQTQYRAPATLLQRPLATASPETLRTALALCEREAALLDEDQEQIVSTARAAMSLGTQGYPDPAALAERLHMSTRTLRRRLQAEACNYSQLLEDARRRDALQLLENPGLEIQQIAGLLGYADPANFTRAFRVWTGNTPSRYRELRGVG